MTGSARIVEVAELDFAYDPAPWGFAEAEADRIARYWAELRKRKPRRASTRSSRAIPWRN